MSRVEQRVRAGAPRAPAGERLGPFASFSSVATRHEGLNRASSCECHSMLIQENLAPEAVSTVSTPRKATGSWLGVCHPFLISHAIAVRGGSAPAPEDLVSHPAQPQHCPSAALACFADSSDGYSFHGESECE